MKTLVVSGGVASYQLVRRRLKELATAEELECTFPAVHLCTDNAVVVAGTGRERLMKGMATKTKNVDVRARSPLASIMDLGASNGG